MTELRSLLDSSDDELERALLRSARSDLPSASGLQETALALGLALPIANALVANLPSAGALGASSGTALGSAASGGVASGSASGVVGSVGAVSFGALGKSLVGGALVSFLALTTYDQTLGAGSQRAPATVVASSPRIAAGPSTRTGMPSAGPAQPLAPAPDVEAPGTEAASAVAGRRRAASAVVESVRNDEIRPRIDAPANAAFASEPRDPLRTDPASANASLAAEIRVLDQARAALAAGESDRASRLLDAYAASRPSPTLAQEAALLRVRLLLTRGQRPAAAALARRIITEHPESAHVDSLRSLAREP